MEHNTLQGVIFDLDGTLLDSTGMWRQVDGRLMAHYGKEVPPDLSETVQRMSIEEFSQFFVEEFDLPVTPEQIAQQVADMVAEEYREKLQLKPHVPEILGWISRTSPTALPRRPTANWQRRRCDGCTSGNGSGSCSRNRMPAHPRPSRRSFSWRRRNCTWADGRSPWWRTRSTHWKAQKTADFSPSALLIRRMRRSGKRFAPLPPYTSTTFWK